MDLPSGTVTFLFTDLESSTRRWEEHPDLMPAALARHDALLEAAITEHDGVVFARMGDGMAAAFGSARDAVAAAVEAQRGLAAEPWPEPLGRLQARMGLHTGEGVLINDQYVNQPLNRCARLMAIAHGGQLVVSGTTEPLVQGGLPEGAVLVDRGAHRLRDLTEAVRVFQVCGPGLAGDVGRLRSMEAFAGNLPVQMTSFVGRDHEFARLVQLLADHRLVTLTGVGGVGKTRLGLQVAAEVTPWFGDGVWFCELAAANNEELLYQTVADAIGARQRIGLSMADSVVEYLRDRTMLVVLDNCEHLLNASAWLVSALLQRCPSVVVLATSREGLGVVGEQLVAVPSLAIPSRDDRTAVSDAMRLFVDRAEAVRSDFALREANQTAVAEICRRLDGIPLAIELAAARVSAMTPMEIAARLDERFRLLTGGRRGRVERHQTLRATVEWSSSLLSDTERRVFDRLGVFVGSFDAATAEAVVTDDAVERWDVIDCLAGLVDKSMVLAEPTDDGMTRYRLLETLRAFAREQLDGAGETDHWRRRQADHYAAFSELACPGLMGPDERTWTDRIEAELDNLRAVLSWGLDVPAQADADLALRIIIALADGSNRWDFGRWAEAMLPRARSSSLSGRAYVLVAAANWLANIEDDLGAAEGLALEALETSVVTDDLRSIELGYFVLASVRYRQDRAADGLVLLAKGHEALDAGGAPMDAHGSLHGLASLLHLGLGDMEGVRKEADTSLAIARATGNPSRMSSALMQLGRALFFEEPVAALAAFEEGISLSIVGGSAGHASAILFDFAAQLCGRLGRRRDALGHLRTAIAASHDVGNRVNLGMTIERAIATLASIRDDELAARCAGIVQSQTVAQFRSLPQVDRTAERVAERLGAAAYQAAYASGSALTYPEVASNLLAALDDELAVTVEPEA
jgi:predicted ATPase/class 3 adenylate cyclase